MKEILILGSLPKNKKDILLYEAIFEICKSFARNVSSPIDTANSKDSDLIRYKRAFIKIKKADLIIGEQTKPSTGQGMEIREAIILKKPILIVAKNGSSVSSLIKGCPEIKNIIYYKTLNDLKTKLKNQLLKLK